MPISPPKSVNAIANPFGDIGATMREQQTAALAAQAIAQGAAIEASRAEGERTRAFATTMAKLNFLAIVGAAFVARGEDYAPAIMHALAMYDAISQPRGEDE